LIVTHARCVNGFEISRQNQTMCVGIIDHQYSISRFKKWMDSKGFLENKQLKVMNFKFKENLKIGWGLT
jgi:hypothetical protein